MFNPACQVLEKRWVVLLDETSKHLILNKTRAQQIAGVTGSDDSDDWIGAHITIFPVETS